MHTTSSYRGPSVAVPRASPDPSDLHSRIDALRGAVAAMRELHGALLGRLDVVRRAREGISLQGTGSVGNDGMLQTAVLQTMQLRGELLLDQPGYGSDAEDSSDHDDDNLNGAAPPASVHAINALYRFRPSAPADGGSSSLCPVCQEPPNGVTVWVQLPACRHSYCENCAVRWLSLSRTCPTCRAVVITPRSLCDSDRSGANALASVALQAAASPTVAAVRSTVHQDNEPSVIGTVVSRLTALRRLPVKPNSSTTDAEIEWPERGRQPATPIIVRNPTPLRRAASAQPWRRETQDATIVVPQYAAATPSVLLTLRRPGTATRVVDKNRPASAIGLQRPPHGGARQGCPAPAPSSTPLVLTRSLRDVGGVVTGSRVVLSTRPQSAVPLRTSGAAMIKRSGGASRSLPFAR